MKYTIREIKETEYGLLNDFLFEAIYVPSGMEPPDRSILDLPEMRVYVDNFSKKFGHRCLVAEVDDKIVGAVWARVMKDYGHVDEDSPSLAISLYKEYRNQGIGTEMMKQMLAMLKKDGYKRASLSVQKANYATKMYKSLGFEIVVDNPEEYIMVVNLQEDRR